MGNAVLSEDIVENLSQGLQLLHEYEHLVRPDDRRSLTDEWRSFIEARLATAESLLGLRAGFRTDRTYRQILTNLIAAVWNLHKVRRHDSYERIALRNVHKFLCSARKLDRNR